MKVCPCCSGQMQRHIEKHQIYWFCRHCWQEMPEIETIDRKASVNLTGSSLAGKIGTIVS